MNIAIDIRALMSGKISGVEIYIINLLHSIFKEHTNYKFYLYYNSFKQIEIENFHYPHVKYIRTRYSNKILNILLSLLRYPKLDKLVRKKGNIKQKIDIFFVPDPRPTPVSNECKKVITFHDLSFIAYKNTFSRKTQLWHTILRPKKEASEAHKIITVSHFTKSELVKYYQIEEGRVEVMYPIIKNTLDSQKKLTPKHLKHLQKKYNLPDKFFLSIGTLEPRKNIPRLIQAFLQWKKEVSSQYKLVISGKAHPSIFKSVSFDKTHDSIIFTGFIDEKDKNDIFRISEGLCYPSLYEGFGLPILEAFLNDTPVLTSNIGAMKEVSQSAAVLVDPNSITSMKNGFNTLIQKKDKLIHSGHLRYLELNNATKLHNVFT